MNDYNYWKIHLVEESPSNKFMKQNICVLDAEVLIEASTAEKAMEMAHEYFKSIGPVTITSLKREEVTES